MNTDYIDIVHLHSCSLDILEKGDVILALEKAKKEGKIRFIAYSGENEELNWAITSGRFDSIQCSVNFCDQRSIDERFPLAVKAGLGIIGKRPLANAPWIHDTPPVGHNSVEYWHRWKKMDINPHDLEWDELALRFSAYAPGVSSCIAGTSKIEHLKKNILAVDKGALDPDLLAHIRSEFSKNDDHWRGLI